MLRLRRMLRAGVLGGGGAAIPSTLLTDLVAYWKLDEASDGSASVQRFDSHGANHLTDNGSIPSRDGIIGSGLDCQAVGAESLSIADNANIRGGDIDLMFWCWVNLTSKATSQWIASKWHPANAADREWLLRYNLVGDRFEFYWYTNATGTSKIVKADLLGSPTVDVDYLIVVWRSRAAQEINIWVNGNLNTTAGAASGNGGSGPLWLGNVAGTPLPLNGLLDECGLRKRAPTDAELTALWNGGSGQSYPFA